MNESGFLAALRMLPLHPGARDLCDDAAIFGDRVFTHDMIVEGVHFLAGDPASDVAWKLLAVNLSDLAAKGAIPTGVLMGYGLAGDDAWDRGFLDGLRVALERFDCPLLGGDTVALPSGAPRMLSLTAIGAAEVAPTRSGARPGDALWVTGTIGDAGAGLAIAQGHPGPAALRDAYRRPTPRLAEGRALAPIVGAMMDVSDGLLIDAGRMAAASGCAVAIDLASVPRSAALTAFAGDTREARLASATAGDDYELLFALAPERTPPVAATCIGRFEAGAGLRLLDGRAEVPLPGHLGYLHSA